MEFMSMQSQCVKKTILFIEQNRDGTVGGSHLCLLQTVRSLDKNAYKAIVMFYQDNSLVDKFKKEECQVVFFKKPEGKRIDVTVKYLKVIATLIQKLYNFFACEIIPFFRAIYFLLKHKVDLVHLNNCPVSGGDWLLAAKLLKKKCISHDRGYAHFNQLTLFLGKRFDLVICMAEWIVAHLSMCGLSKEKLKVLYDGVEADALMERILKPPQLVRDEFNVAIKAPFIGLVGNIQEWKGQVYAIRAITILRRKIPDICCLLIGGVSPSGPDKTYWDLLNEEIKKENLEKNVIMTGFRNDIPDLMNAVDIVLHTSIQPEPFGMVLLEAMSLKKPLIATDFGGPREIVENSISGILVPPEEPFILAEKIAQLLENPDMRRNLGENAYKRVKDVFNMEQFTINLNRMYAKLFNRECIS
jgi:glycosyltransferase involved in cell wall biosynthesis